MQHDPRGAHPTTRIPKPALLCAGVLTLLASACNKSSNRGATAAAAPAISGTWKYQTVASTANGLDYANVQEKPIRKAVVQLLRQPGGEVLATGTTSDTGTWSLQWNGTGNVVVRVQALIQTPDMRVEDNTSGDALWTAQSPVIAFANKDLTGQNFTAQLGWNGTGYASDAARVSAPFAILDTAYEAVRQILAARPALTIPPVKINWSPKNTPTGGNVALGQIGTSNYDGTEVYILGKEDVDTDEFDTFTVVHEWGHFFEAQLSRSDNPGNMHTTGDLLTPPLAFGEGYGYGLAAIVNAPNNLYADATGPRQSVGAGSFDIEQMPTNADPKPGWYSEFTIAGLLYDLYDDTPNEAGDTVALGLGPILDVLTGPQKTTQGLTSIFSFLHYLKQANAAQAAAIDATAARNISPVADIWGSTETNNAGAVYHLPVFQLVTVGGPPVTVTLHGREGGGAAGVGLQGAQSNKLPANRLIRFQGTGGQITFNVTTTPPTGAPTDHDVALQPFDSGTAPGVVNGVQSGTETFSVPTENGKWYVVRIIDIGDLDGVYTATVSVVNA